MSERILRIGIFDTNYYKEFDDDDIKQYMSDVIECVNKFDAVSKIKNKDNMYPDTDDVIAWSDMVIGAPFSSVVIEAWSSRKPACWYDPYGKFTGCPYDAYPLLAKGKSQLIQYISELSIYSPEQINNVLNKFKDRIDCYHDGNAKERFRNLLKR